MNMYRRSTDRFTVFVPEPPTRAELREEDDETKRCVTCNGNGVNDCETCDGSGERLAAHLSSVRFPGYVECKDCDGIGLIDCEDCDGAGYEEP